MNGGEIYGCQSAYGGAISEYARIKTFIIDGALIHDNRAVGNGTGAYTVGGGISLLDSVTNSTISITNSKIYDNTAFGGGGGLFIMPTGGDTTTITNCEITGNTCGVNPGAGTDIYAAGGGMTIRSSNATITDCTITGNSSTAAPDSADYAGDGGGIMFWGSINEDGLTIDGTTTISNNSATSDGGGVYIDYAKLANLSVGSDVTFSDNTARYRSHILDSDIPLHEQQVQTNTFSNAMPYGYNNYDISYPPYTTLTPPNATKTLSGKALAGNDFTFGIYNGDTQVATATNDANGNIVFPDINFDTLGTFNYTVKEVTQSSGGLTTDSTTYPLTITNAAGSDGWVAVTATPTTGFNFVNTYAATPAVLPDGAIAATKIANGKALAGGDFTFGLYDTGAST
jgi:predicted outer membrane repeat protein